jgi:hypothetical protein
MAPDPTVPHAVRSAAFAETLDRPLGNKRTDSSPRLRSALRFNDDGSPENLLELLAGDRVRDDVDAAVNSRRLGQVELAIDQPSDRVHSPFDDALAQWQAEIRDRFSIWHGQ